VTGVRRVAGRIIFSQTGPREVAVSSSTSSSPSLFVGFALPALIAILVVAWLPCDPAHAARPRKNPFEKPKEEKAWINGKGMCVFPFADERLPDTADDFAAAMERGYRRALKLPDEDAKVVTAAGGTYPIVDSLRIDVCDSIIKNPENKRKPSDRQLPIHGLDAARFEFLGRGMVVEQSTVNLSLTATDARLLFTRDKDGKPLLMLGSTKAGHFSAEMTLDDVEALLLAAARKGSRAYGLTVDRTRLRLTVEDGRTVRVDLKLFTRVGFVPAGLRFRARLDINDDLTARLSELSCTGDDVLGPLIGGLIQPFFARYNGTTRPLMNFPQTEMRLSGIQITADDTIRVAADFGN
jgi:hypothetical protein